MAQPQGQYQMPPQPQPQRSYSPPQNAQSPSSQFGLPPSKRQRVGNDSPQPGSPYNQSPYGAMNSNSSNMPPASNPSPHFSNVQLPQGIYNTPYSNGHTSGNLNLPQSNHQSSQQSNILSGFERSNHLDTSRPDFSSYGMMAQQPQGQGQGQGTMGPPLKPSDRKDDMDPMDALGGTGVNLREEEEYAFQMYSNSFNSQVSGSQSGTITSSHSFTQYPPGDEASFYGAGPANAGTTTADAKSQEEYQQKRADQAWREAARNLAVSRQHELDNPFLEVGLVQRKFARATKGVGIEMHTDSKGLMGFMSRPDAFQQRDVRVQTSVGSNGIITTTQGHFLPLDSMLVDQVALISIATKQRLRTLIEDAAKLAKGRQTGSHGIIPEDWAEAAELKIIPDSSIVGEEGGPRFGWESAVSPHSNPLKRPFSDVNKLPTPPAEDKKKSLPNDVVVSLRRAATKERDAEEERLKKRQARAAATAGGPGTSARSSLPSTPGSIAPEVPDKAPSKKEQKKKAEAKMNEAASHAAANRTTAQFMGGGGGLFGKKGKKSYSWLASGDASGTSTPGARPSTQGLPGTPAAMNESASVKLTSDGVRRLGAWREDREKGLGIQLRDWIVVLEEDGREKRALQKAYIGLDDSNPK